MSKLITFENKYYSTTQEILNSIKEDESFDLLIDLSKETNQNKDEIPRGFNKLDISSTKLGSEYFKELRKST